MPYRKRAKKGRLVPDYVLRKVGRKLFKKNRNDYASRDVIVYRNPSDRMFMPPRFRTVLVLNVLAQIPAESPAAGYKTCLMNGLYHPFNTANAFTSAPGATAITGLSPAGYDKLSSIYNQNRVTSCKVSYTVLPTSAADELFYAIAPALPGEAPLSVDQADGVNHSKGPTIASTFRHTHLTKYITTKRVVGNTVQGDLTQYNANRNEDPNNQIRWDFAYRSCSNAVLTDTISIAIKLKYWVDFFNIASNNIEPGD